MPPRFGKSWDDIRKEGYEQGCKDMREPMECGHPKACWEYSELHGFMSQGEPSFQDASYCTTCAQQRELREAFSNLICQMDRCHTASQYAFSLAAIHGNPYSGPTYEKELAAARRALGEKEAKKGA